jgi:hypothetical protein
MWVHVTGVKGLLQDLCDLFDVFTYVVVAAPTGLIYRYWRLTIAADRSKKPACCGCGAPCRWWRTRPDASHAFEAATLVAFLKIRHDVSEGKADMTQNHHLEHTLRMRRPTIVSVVFRPDSLSNALARGGSREAVGDVTDTSQPPFSSSPPDHACDGFPFLATSSLPSWHQPPR